MKSARLYIHETDGPRGTLEGEGHARINDVLPSCRSNASHLRRRWIPDGHADQPSPRLSPIMFKMEIPKHAETLTCLGPEKGGSSGPAKMSLLDAYHPRRFPILQIHLSWLWYSCCTSIGLGCRYSPAAMASMCVCIHLANPWSRVPSQLRKCFRQAHNGPSVANRKSKRPRKIRSQDEGLSLQRAKVVEFHRLLRFSFCL